MRLRGTVVATTRDGQPEDRLVQLLKAEGARVLVWPTLTFADPEDPAPLDVAAGALDQYDWVLFTSARAVSALTSRVSAPGKGVGVAAVGVAAVGAATAAALEQAGWPVQVVGDGGASALVDALSGGRDLSGVRVLFPAASMAGHTVDDALRARGADVDRVEAYRTVPSPPNGEQVHADLQSGVDIITFASPSAVRSLAQALGAEWPGALSECGVAAIGPTTSSALAEAGVTEITAAPETTIEGLVDACVHLMNRT